VDGVQQALLLLQQGLQLPDPTVLLLEQVLVEAALPAALRVAMASSSCPICYSHPTRGQCDRQHAAAYEWWAEGSRSPEHTHTSGVAGGIDKPAMCLHGAMRARPRAAVRLVWAVPLGGEPTSLVRTVCVLTCMHEERPTVVLTVMSPRDDVRSGKPKPLCQCRGFASRRRLSPLEFPQQRQDDAAGLLDLVRVDRQVVDRAGVP
jgi:hypothetical protein